MKTEDSQTIQRLPGVLNEIVEALGDHLAVSPGVGTALIIQTLSSALGPAARLVDGQGSPLPAELNTVVIAPPGSTVSLARQALLSPLLAIQDDLWALAGEQPPSILLPDRHQEPVEDRASKQPVAILAAPMFDELQAALVRSFDGSVLAVYDPGSFDRFWPDLQADNNGSRWRSCQQLMAGRMKVPKQGVPRREVVHLLIETRPDAPAGRGFLTGLPAEFFTRLLLVNAGPRPTRWPADPALPTELADAWAELVRNILARRGAPPQLIPISPEAGQIFSLFHTEMLGHQPPWPDSVEEIVFGWPILARRLALVLHQAGDDLEQPLQADQARAGIALARNFGGAILAIREAAARELAEAGQLADRQRLVAKLKKMGEVDFRSLYRVLPGQSPARWWPVLESLLADGLVVELPEGKYSLAEHQLRRLLTV